ncbi:hypothetical protein KEM60_01159 [Austwickia sp. TVS 96-490-7B]|uniref:hypothetical protein n=1 Tax=Austwickia sp. TVS 96-490-7B TaxID=2830843 RepID=UPI001C59CA1C|nr:hypothetical protein [Austwickia sp. TVS 96-490-7B]MBW3084968.1 hypothetical protein [Austwickia sp. TVS 96-490-7B]
MPSYDFEVDLPALTKAAESVGVAVETSTKTFVADFMPTEAALGHAVVWGAVCEFMDRWQLGTEAMTADVEEISSRLTKVAGKYVQFEEQGSARLKGSVGQLPSVPRPGV